jgi:hypothetical protein
MTTIWPESESKGIGRVELDPVDVHIDSSTVVRLSILPTWTTDNELAIVAGPGPGIVALLSAHDVDRHTGAGIVRHVRREDVAMVTRVRNLREGLAETQLKLTDLCAWCRDWDLSIAFASEQGGLDGQVDSLVALSRLCRAAQHRYLDV